MVNTNLQRARIQKGLRVEYICDKTGISEKTYRRLEAGTHKPHKSTLDYICILFGMTPEELGFSLTNELDTNVNQPINQTDNILVTLSKEEIASLITFALGDNPMKHIDISRRTILQILGLAGVSITTSDMLNPETWERLAQATNNSSNIDLPTLEHFTKLNEACWFITNTSEISTVERILPTYLPQLIALAKQPSKYQPIAASLASQGYLLAGLVALDQFNIDALEKYSQSAVQYSQLAKDYNLHVAALKQQATMYQFANKPEKALKIYMQTLPIINNASPLLQSRIYQGIARINAQCGMEQEATQYIGRAYDTFPLKFEDDPSFLYADSGLSVLYMYDGLTHLDLGHAQEAYNAFNKVNGLNPTMPIGELTQLEFINLQAKAATALKDMELACTLIEASVIKANQLKSQWGRNDALEAYQIMRIVWSNEKTVLNLKQIFMEV